MRNKGYFLTRFADDWVVTCTTRNEAESTLDYADRVLNKLGVALNRSKPGIVHVKQGFEFLGYKRQFWMALLHELVCVVVEI